MTCNISLYLECKHTCSTCNFIHVIINKWRYNNVFRLTFVLELGGGGGERSKAHIVDHCGASHYLGSNHIPSVRKFISSDVEDQQFSLDILVSSTILELTIDISLKCKTPLIQYNTLTFVPNFFLQLFKYKLVKWIECW